MRIFLPILWFVLNVLSFNTFRRPYEQNKLGYEHEKITCWSKSSSGHSSNKNSQIYFLPEEFEENLEEDTDGESDIQFLDCDLGNATNSYRLLSQLKKPINGISVPNSRTSPAINRAKFIIYHNIRV